MYSITYLLAFLVDVLGISLSEFAERRDRLAVAAVNAGKSEGYSGSHVILVPGATQVFSSHHVPYPFRQHSDFRYFTGFNEPDALLCIEVEPSTHSVLPMTKTSLFVREPDERRELWEGPSASASEIPDYCGIEQGRTLNEISPVLKSISSQLKIPWLWYVPEHINIANQIESSVKELLTGIGDRKFGSWRHPKVLFDELRLIKSSAEIALMRRSCKIMSETMRELMKYSFRHRNESILHGKLELEFRRRGADRLAYPPVIAGGNHANTIHYLEGKAQIAGSDLLLVDAGCDFHGYASDVTRTWPINGLYSQAQNAVYMAVLDTQLCLMDICATQRPMTLNDLHVCMMVLLGENLQKSEIISKSLSKEEAARAAEKYCPHHVGHYLGMDVHDSDSVSKTRPLEPGMVITIEPGLYFPAKDSMVPKEFRGIAVRIEDDVLITDAGCEILTESCPKLTADIEDLMAKE